MKKLLLPLLALVIVACGEKKAQTTSADLSGEWVNVKYINAINETKSPVDAQKTVNLAEVVFGDGLVQIIINFHEGAEAPLDSLGDGKFVFTVDEISYNVSLFGDTLTVNDDRFVRLAPDATVNTAIVNPAILAGKYQSADGKCSVELMADGTITGCDKMSFYNIHIDYYGDEVFGNVVDFSSADGRDVRYTWVVDGDKVVFTNIPYQIEELMSEPVVGEDFTLIRVAK